MSRNGLYAVIGVLVIVVVSVVGYLVYQQSQQPSLAISVGKDGIQVQGNG